MFPSGALNELARAKARIRERITLRRTAMVEHVVGAVQPLVWADAAWGLWRALSPVVKLLAVPAGLLAARKTLPRMRLLLGLARWLPLLRQIARQRAAAPARRPRDSPDLMAGPPAGPQARR